VQRQGDDDEGLGSCFVVAEVFPCWGGWRASMIVFFFLYSTRVEGDGVNEGKEGLGL
jgi:hypothetical protein